MSMKKEKVFEHYVDMPAEVRKMVNDEMNSDDRCRFTRCSKLSNEEAKSSKHYIHSLKFYAAEQYTKIVISHNKYNQFYREYQGYSLKYKEEEGTKCIICVDKNEKEFWREDLNYSTDLVLYAAEYFKHLLSLHQKIIKSLGYSGEAFSGRLKNYEFGINSLNNLERLEIDGDLDTEQYFSKLRRPLKHLSVGYGENNTNLANCEEIYQTKNFVDMGETKLTYEQMLRFSAPIVTMPFGDITEMQICHFIRSWQSGTVGKEVKRYVWKNSSDLKFDIIELCRLLDLEHHDGLIDDLYFEIKQFNEVGRIAVLGTNFKRLSFEVSGN